MKQHCVYELINHYGTIEYVGVSYRPDFRFYQHTKVKPKYSGMGKFYRRQDLVLNKVAMFSNKKDALVLEGQLKLQYGIEWTEKTRSIKAGNKSVQSGRINIMRKLSNEKCMKSINQYSKSNQLVKEWESIISASKTLLIDKSSICNCALGNRISAGGYIWKYKQ